MYAIEIVDLSIKMMIFHGYVSVPEGMCIYIYIHLVKFDHDRTLVSRTLESCFFWGNHPLLWPAEVFRLCSEIL